MHIYHNTINVIQIKIKFYISITTALYILRNYYLVVNWVSKLFVIDINLIYIRFQQKWSSWNRSVSNGCGSVDKKAGRLLLTKRTYLCNCQALKRATFSRPPSVLLQISPFVKISAFQLSISYVTSYIMKYTTMVSFYNCKVH